MIRVTCKPGQGLDGKGVYLYVRTVQNAPRGLLERLKAYLRRYWR